MVAVTMPLAKITVITSMRKYGDRSMAWHVSGASPPCLLSSMVTRRQPESLPLRICEAAVFWMCPRAPHICWNCTRISLKVSVMTAMNTFFTSHARKKIIVLK
ncbi:uncharacterized protein DMAD_01220 [Drosophila madeirensis]|uniref:Uncharacterized protein n=1 Tax=Drosophila madeirensis TaxID=30013 RepID=A0AAU9G0D9_DROMD